MSPMEAADFTCAQWIDQMMAVRIRGTVQLSLLASQLVSLSPAVATKTDAQLNSVNFSCTRTREEFYQLKHVPEQTVKESSAEFVRI